MRKLLPLLAVLYLAPAAGADEAPALSLEVGRTLVGTPLRATVALDDPRRRLELEFFLDGEAIAADEAPAGSPAEVTFSHAILAAGSHRLQARSGELTAEVRFQTSWPGWLSVLPPLLAIGLALITRDVLISLFLGVFGGALILHGQLTAALGRTIDHFVLDALADPDHAAILIFTSLLGAMVGLISKSGGTHGIVERLARFATSVRRGQLATWAMGLAIFFDDYANTLIVGPTMRPITDKLRISREKLAYIVDSTAAPVVSLIPISTWVGFEIGLINDAFRSLGTDQNGYAVFLSSIPYRFYPIFAIVLVGVVAVTGLDFGPMRRAERRARQRGELLEPGAVPIADYAADALEPPAGIPKRARNAVIPILTVISLTVLGLYLSGAAGVERQPGTGTLDWLRLVLTGADSYKALLWASLGGTLIALLLPLVQRLLTLRQAMSALVEGVKAMLMAFLVLIFAWSLGAVCGELGTASYLVGLARDVVAPAWLPVLTFVLAAAISFATGTAWGTMAILELLVIPICHNLALNAGHAVGDPYYSVLMAGTIASVLAGAVWGDHCSPISDTTILSSMASGCDHIAHVRTQLPYALTMGLLAIAVGIVPAGHGLNPWLANVLGIGVITGTVIYLGRERAARRAAAAAADSAPDAEG